MMQKAADRPAKSFALLFHDQAAMRLEGVSLHFLDSLAKNSVNYIDFQPNLQLSTVLPGTVDLHTWSSKGHPPALHVERWKRRANDPKLYARPARKKQLL